MIVSRHRRENAPSSDVFGHNPARPSRHENVGCDFDSGAAHDLGGRGVGPDSDEQSAGDAQDELNFFDKLWGTTMLSVDQFLRLISVPAVVAAFLIASQVSGGGIFHHAPAQLASE